MTVNIRKHLVSNNVAKRVTYPGTNSKKYIVIHETANTRKGANANAHARLQASGNSRQASWHYQVDDKEIVQSFSDNVQCWHAGNRKYNEQSLGIEICVNEDGDFRKAVDNAAKLTRHLMDKYKIPASNVIQHHTSSGKNCPHYLRSGEKDITWNDFKAKITSTTKPKNTPNAKKTTTTSSYKGNSIVEYLKSIGVDSSFANRRKLAKNHGIKLYVGTAGQNLLLLSLLRSGSTISKQTTTKKTSMSISQMADKIIRDPKAPIGHEARRKWLGVDKATYEKVRQEINKRLKQKRA